LEDIEDQNVLLYTEKVKGKTRTVMRMKICPHAGRKLLAQPAGSVPEFKA